MLVLPLGLAAVAMVSLVGSGLVLAQAAEAFDFERLLDTLGAGVVGGVALFILAAGSLLTLMLAVYQWFLISTRGQTIGKRLFGVKIVRHDGARIGFVRGVLLRVWVFSFVLGLVASIPVVGPYVGLLTLLPIVGQQRRCLHDYLAGTKVVSCGRVVGVGFVLLLVLFVGGLAALGAQKGVEAVPAWLPWWSREAGTNEPSKGLDDHRKPERPHDRVEPKERVPAPDESSARARQPPGTIYQWVDDAGVRQLTNTPPPSHIKDVQAITPATVANPATSRERPQAEKRDRLSGALKTKASRPEHVRYGVLTAKAWRSKFRVLRNKIEGVRQKIRALERPGINLVEEEKLQELKAHKGELEASLRKLEKEASDVALPRTFRH